MHMQHGRQADRWVYMDGVAEPDRDRLHSCIIKNTQLLRSTNVSLLLTVSIFRKSDDEKGRDQKQEDGKINTRRKVLRSRQQRVELEDLEDINYINYVFMTTSAQDRSQATTSYKSIKK